MIAVLKPAASLSFKASTLKFTSTLSVAARRTLLLNVVYTESICTAPDEIPRISAIVFLNLSCAERPKVDFVYPLSVYEAEKLARAGGGGGKGGGEGGGGGGDGGGGGFGATQSDLIIVHVFTWFIVEHEYFALNFVAPSNMCFWTLVAAVPVHPDTS